jgi:DNA repair protein RecO (recombination protein O)
VDRTYTVTAINLRSYPFKEADKILVLMTREEGIKRVVAKGLRKPKSRIGGRLEPLRENTVMLAKGRSMDVVTQVESLRAFSGPQQDFDLLAAAMSAAELLIAFCEDDDPNPEAYDLYVELLSQLKPGADGTVLLTAFELQLLDVMGYRPELEVCLSCDRVFEEPSDVYGLNIDAGGAICTHCEGLGAGRVRRLSAGAYQILRALQDTPLDECGGITGTQALLANCRHALREYLSFRAERELKAQTMFDWVPAAPGRVPSGS